MNCSSPLIATDSFGNVYLAYSFSGDGTVTVGAETFPSTASTSSIVLKLDISGNLLWTQHLGPLALCHQLAFDDSDNLLVTGYANDGANIFGHSVSNGSPLSLFLTKVSPAGTRIWSKRVGSTSGARGYSLSLDTEQNIYVTGTYQGTLSISTVEGTVSLNSGAEADTILLKYDADGTLLWLKEIATGSSQPVRMVTDSAGDCFIAGTFTGNTVFGSTNLSITAFTGSFLAQTDGTGNVKSVYQISGTNNVTTFDLVQFHTPRGIQLIWGVNALGTATFGSETSVGNGPNSPVIFSISEVRETIEWAVVNRPQSSSTVFGSRLFAANGEILLAGQMQGTTTFGATNVTSIGAGDAYLASINSVDAWRWVIQGGSATGDSGTSIVVDQNGAAYLAGTARSGFSIADSSLGSFTQQRVFLAKFLYRDPPRLEIQLSDGFIRVQWPAIYTGFTLHDEELPNFRFLFPVSTTPTLEGTNNVVTLPLQGSSKLFRLKQDD